MFSEQSLYNGYIPKPEMKQTVCEKNENHTLGKISFRIQNLLNLNHQSEQEMGPIGAPMKNVYISAY